MNLVFHQAALGDFALILPILRGMAGRTTVVCPWSRGRLASAVVPGVSAMDIDLFEFTRLHGDPGPTTLSPAVAELFAEAQRVVTFIGNGQDIWAANVRRLAPQSDLIWLPTRPAEGGEPMHLADLHRSLLEERGVSWEEREAVAIGDEGGPMVVHPGSGGEAKCWPRERFEQVIERYRQHGREVRVVYGEAEAERWPARELARWREVYQSEACGTLAGLVERLTGASGYLGNDAGPTHLAAQLGVATTALFGPTDPRVWAPRGPAGGGEVRVVAPATPRAMDWLEVETLWRRLAADGPGD